MAAPRVRADYDQLGQVAQKFSQQGDSVQSALGQLRQQMEVLQNGDWVGAGATAFYAEMNDSVLPTVGRLAQALHTAQQVTQQISREMKAAEEGAAACFRADGQGGGLSSGSFAGAGAVASGTANVGASLKDRVLDSLGGALGTIGFGMLGAPLDALGEKLGVGAIATDLTRGFIDEGADMLSGLWHMAAHPIDTVQGLAYGVTHPGQLWDAFKKPYVEAWESGHPFQAIGRGVLAVGSFFVGGEAGEAGEVAAEAGKAAKMGEIASDTGKIGEVAETAETAGRAGRVGESGKVGEVAETGGRFGKQIDITTRWEEYAPKAYDAIRASTEDVSQIAKNTGFSETEIQAIKDHVFNNEHMLDDGLARFDADPDIADAWQRMQTGQQLPQDLDLLKHEAFELNFEKTHNVNYRTAHQAAIDAGFEWKPPVVE